MVAASLLSLALYWMIKSFFQPILHGGTMRELTRVTLIVLGVALARSLAMCGQIYFTNLVGQRLVADLRQRVYAHLMRLSVGFFDSAKTGELMSRLTNDMSALQVMLVNTVIEMLSAPLMIVGGTVALFCLSWRLSLLACLCLPLIVFLIRRAGRRMNWAAAQSLLKLADLSEVMQERLSAIRIINTFGTQDVEIATFSDRNNEAFRARMREARVQTWLLPSIELLAALGLISALWFGGREALAGRVPSESILTFAAMVQQVYSNVRKLGNVVLVLQQVSAAASRVFELLDQVPAIQDLPDAKRLERVEGAVRFDRVHFSYNGARTPCGRGEPVLRDISFDVQPGEVVALVGSSGAGKTTVASLVPRLYDVSAGSILVDGHDLRQIELLSLRSQMGVVPQETTLFSGTIADNILYGRPEAAPEEVCEAARKANAAEFIEGMPAGYETLVGERGVKLSGGQRQRIAIARALLRDPRILILDEATSSLDAESESLVQEALEILMQNRTTLVIAHRLSTIRKADRILVLQQGRIVEEGTHDELMAREGHYAKLYAIQTGRASAEEPTPPPVDELTAPALPT
jgi:subfamily B ATP-binding cassette protein MsbA